MLNNIYIHNTQYYIFLAILIVSVIGFFVILSMDFSKEAKEEKIAKKSKIRKIAKSNVARDTLQELLDERMSFKKRKEVEGCILQAGSNLSVVDLYVSSIGLAILLGCLVGFALNNLFLVFVFAIVGFILPKQVLVFRGRRRKEKLNTQVGTFINVVIGRYEMLNDFSESLRMSIEECHGQEPISTEIKKTVMDLDLGLSVNEALDNMTLRTGNKHILKLANNYRVATNIGTKEARKQLLSYVIDEYNQQTVSEAQLKRELKGPIMEAYLMCAMVPAVVVMQAVLTEGYVDFMTNTTLGKIGTAVIVTTLMLGIWFINAKVSAPIE